MIYGADLSVSCTVETCISDMVVQIFSGDQLVDSTTVQERTRLVAYAYLKATEDVLGTYVCQAMSEYENAVFRKTFTITGKLVNRAGGSLGNKCRDFHVKESRNFHSWN